MHWVHFFALREEPRMTLNTGTFGATLGLIREALGTNVTGALHASFVVAGIKIKRCRTVLWYPSSSTRKSLFSLLLFSPYAHNSFFFI